MSLLDKLKVFNFQSHKETELNFSKGINLIIGESDAGKSSLIRALNWIINNKPSGDSFRSFWGGTTKVCLIIDNETIRRKRGDKINEYYYLGMYKAFRNEIPEYVKRKLNIGEINLQKQLDSPFLFSLNAGEVARYLNKIVSLDVIDKSMTNMGKIIREENSKLKYEKERIVELKEKKKNLSWVKEANEKLLNLENMDKKLKSLSNKKEVIENILNEYYSIKRKYEIILRKIKKTPDINKIMKLRTSYETIELKYLDLEKQIDLYNNMKKDMNKLEEILKEKEKLFKDKFPDYCPMCGKGG